MSQDAGVRESRTIPKVHAFGKSVLYLQDKKDTDNKTGVFSSCGHCATAFFISERRWHMDTIIRAAVALVIAVVVRLLEMI